MTLLSDAAAIVSSSSSWCTGANARSASGEWVPIMNTNATSWDILGALEKAYRQGSFGLSDLHSAYEHVRSKIPAGFHSGNQDIELYNDALSFGDIAAIFS